MLTVKLIDEKCELEKQSSLEKLKSQIEAQAQEKMQQQLAQLTLEARQKAKAEAEEALQQILNERVSKLEKENQQKLQQQLNELSKQAILKTNSSRQEKSKLNERYLVKGGLVKGMLTGLMWMRCSLGQNWNGSICEGEVAEYEWKQALNVASDFSYTGYSDWRVPTIKELNTLVYCSNGKTVQYKEDGYSSAKSEGGYGCESDSRGDSQRPTIRQSVFPNTPSNIVFSWFWSSSTSAYYSDSAWLVGFGNGYDFKNNNYAVRLVREG